MNFTPGNIPEFTTDPADGHWLNGTCGETALEDEEAAAGGFQATVAGMLAIYHDMRAHSQADYNGASTLSGLAREAERQGYKIKLEWDYEEPLPATWHQVLLDNAGKYPIVLQVARYANLRDAETGVGDGNGQYHFIGINGTQPDGYVCSDGANPQDKARYQIYSYATLAAAVPCGLLMLETKEASVPMAFHQNPDKTGTDDKGNHCGEGMLNDIQANRITADALFGETYVQGAQTFKSFMPMADGEVLVWDGSKVTHDGAKVAAELLRLLTEARTQPAPAPAGIPANIKSDLATALNALQPLVAAAAAIADALK